MMTMKTVARPSRTPDETALGYLNAAREAARHALFYLPNNHPARKRVETLIRKVTEAEEVFPKEAQEPRV